MRIVLDTDVLIAAALRGGFSEEILELASSLETLIISGEILAELRDKLATKFHWEGNDIDHYISYLQRISESVEITEKVFVTIKDPEDNKILECALYRKADLIVTSDRDLLKIKNFRGIGIIHPRTLSWTFPEYFKGSRKTTG